jgi:hypothetical protein
VNSDGYALRWRLAADYAVHPNVAIGLGYEGHFISVEQASNGRATSPRNETIAHTIAATVGLRF